MDLTQVINDIGLEKVERYLTIYNRGRTVPYGNIDTLLNLINQFSVEFDSQRVKLPIERSELKEFLECFCAFLGFGIKR